MSQGKGKPKTKPQAKLQLRTKYDLLKKWEPFYTGGRVEVSNSENYLLCVCGDKIKIVNVDSGLVEKELSHDGDDVTCLAVSPDDSMIVTSTKSLLLKQWEWKMEVKCVRTWRAIHTFPVVSMDFDPTSTLLATGGSDGTIKVWDMIRQYCTHNFRGSPGIVNCVAFHPNNLTLYSAADDYNIRVWDLNSSKLVKVLNSHVSSVTCLKFSNMDCLVSAGRDNVVCLWNVMEGGNEPYKVIPVFESVEAVILVPKELEECFNFERKENETGFLIITAGSKGQLRVWESSNGKCVFTNPDNDPNVASGYIHAKLFPDTNKMVAVTFDHCIDCLDMNGLTVNKQMVGYNDEIVDLKLLGENDSHIIVVTNSPHIKVFNMESSACQVLKKHSDTVLCVDVFKNRTHFVSSSKDNTVCLWKMEENTYAVTCLVVGAGHTHDVGAVTCCNNKMDFLVSGSQDQTLKIWTINETFQLRVKHTVMAHSKNINSIVVSPNDKLIASGSQDKLAKLWKVSDGSVVGTFKGHKRGIWCVQFSPMDQVLATSSADGSIKLWSLSDFTCLKTLEGHDCSVLKVIFIAKGTQMVSCGSDGLLKLWTIKLSECIQTVEAHDEKAWALCSDVEDTMIISGGADSIISFWKDVTDEQRREDIEAKQKTMLHHQELQNLLQEKKYEKALHFAIKLSQPFTALNVIKELMWETDGYDFLNKYLSILRLDQKSELLKFVVSWNTNSRNCHEAHAVLKALLSNTAPEDFEQIENYQSVIESLLPYTERHFHRMNKISQQATFVDYTWQLIKMKE
ncbi:transducin beta-like protein 3 [Ciona intestinalis]